MGLSVNVSNQTTISSQYLCSEFFLPVKNKTRIFSQIQFLHSDWLILFKAMFRNTLSQSIFFNSIQVNSMPGS